MKNERWVIKLIDEAGHQRIREAVQRTEKRTSAEIVPMIVRGSMSSGHVPWLLFFILLISAWLVLPVLAENSPSLSEMPDWVLDVSSFVMAWVLTLALGHLDLVKRLLTPRQDQTLGVERRAILEFHLAHIESTEERTGILVFVSVLERRAVILADRAIVERLPESTWNDVVALLTAKIKIGEFAAGMCAAIDALGDLLEKEFPSRPGHANQLDDGLIVKM